MNSKIHLVGKTIVEPDNIVYLKADSNYTEVYLQNGRMVKISKSLKELEKKLPLSPFFRIHKSYLVNMNFIKKINTNDIGNSIVLLDNNKIANISRRKKTAFKKALAKNDFCQESII